MAIPGIGDDQIIELAGIYASDPLNNTKDLNAYLRDVAYYGDGYVMLRSTGISHEDARDQFQAASSVDGYYTVPIPGMLSDDVIINFASRWVARYSELGRLQKQSNVDNARDLLYWLIVYLRYREQGYNDESALEQMENGMCQEAGVPIPFPSTLPNPPTRDEICAGVTRFQGLAANTQQYGAFNCFGPEITSLDLQSDRNEWYNDHLNAGATVLEVALSWNYDDGFKFAVPGKDLSNDLSTLGDRLIEALSYVSPDGKRFKGIWLFMAGDGVSAAKNADGSYPYNDPNGWTYGWQWLMDNSNRIVSFLKNYKGIDLTKYILFIPGYDGCVPGWAGPENEWTRVNSWLIYMRNLVGFTGYIGLEFSAGYPNWSGEGVADFTTAAGDALDVVLGEGPYPMGPPNNPPNDFCNQLNEVRAPFDQVWQIWSRWLGNSYRRPANQPSCDDPSVHSNVPQTSRGKRYFHAYEWDTYGWVRNEIDAVHVEIHRQVYRDLGVEYVH